MDDDTCTSIEGGETFTSFECAASVISTEDEHLNSTDDDDDDYDEEEEEENEEGGEIEEEYDYDNDNNDELQHSDESHVAAELVRRENVVVSKLRTTVMAVVSIVATIVSSTVYWTQTSYQRHAYNEAFYDASRAILTKFHNHLTTTIPSALDSFVTDITTYSKLSSQVWPFVTMPDFDRKATNFLTLTDSDRIMFLPMVTEMDRNEWELYSQQHYTDWTATSFESVSTKYKHQKLKYSSSLLTISTDDNVQFQDSDTFLRGSDKLVVSRRLLETQSYEFKRLHMNSNEQRHIHEHIYNFSSANTVDGVGPFLPVWQSSPVTNEIFANINLDLMTVPHLHDTIQHVYMTQQPVFAPFISYDFLSPRNGSDDDSTTEQLLSALYYPILQDNNSSSTTNVSGILATMWKWETLFSNLIPSSSKGLIAVVEANCSSDAGTTTNNTYVTYQINAQNIKYLGNGDLHPKQYDSMKLSSVGFHSLNSKSIQFASAIGPSCVYELYLYPTKEMYQYYFTYYPMILTSVVLVMFLLLWLLFSTYDDYVERRQKKVLDHAVRSDDILASLFPQNVRQRLFGAAGIEVVEEHDTSDFISNNNESFACLSTDDQTTVHGDSSFTAVNYASAEDFNNDTDVNYEYNLPLKESRAPRGMYNDSRSSLLQSNGSRTPLARNTRHNSSNRCTAHSSRDSQRSLLSTNHSRRGSFDGHGTKPIADLFPRCTVLFADIAGFTAWSSLRDPSQVFLLLESVYHSFDRIARRLRVFKVETIGDSYVGMYMFFSMYISFFEIQSVTTNI
jgi:Adenylate and Guanylate cyclase catalytic domain